LAPIEQTERKLKFIKKKTEDKKDAGQTKTKDNMAAKRTKIAAADI